MPASKTVTIDDLINICPPGTDPRIRQWLGRVLAETQRRNRARAERVLKYDDLREALRNELGINPYEWNGYVEPLQGQDMTAERVHSPKGRPNLRKRTTDDSPSNRDDERRKSLIAIVSEAWQRDLDAGLVEPEQAIEAMFPFPIPGLKAPERTLSADTDLGEFDGEQQTLDDEIDDDEREQTFMRGPGRQQPRRTSRADRRR